MSTKKVIIFVVIVLILWPILNTLSKKIRTERLVNKYLIENNLTENIKQKYLKFDSKQWRFTVVIEFKDDPGCFYRFKNTDRGEVYNLPVDKGGNSVHNAKYDSDIIKENKNRKVFNRK